MKAAQISQYGGEEAVVINEVAKPSASPGHVLVEIHAASVNPFDWKVREGMYKDMIPLEFPATLGGDLSGIVVEVGEGVEGFNEGQEVYGQANALGKGSLAELASVKAVQLASKPLSLDFFHTAALPLAASSAYQALYEHLKLSAGQKILIHGGSGGIGSIAIQLAKLIGAYVATTASANSLDYVKELGADKAINYEEQDFSELVKDYDAVFDTVGGETTKKSYAVLKPHGHLVSMVANVDPDLKQKYDIEFTQQSTTTKTKVLNEISKLVDGGQLSVNVDKVFPLERAAQALEYLKTAHPRGKVVVSVKS